MIVLPSLTALARHAGRYVLEATIVPLVLFYGLLSFFGLRWALVAALAWSYSALVRRLIRRERIPGILVLGTLLITVRTVIAMATGSVFLYFLQPTLGTYLVAALFLISVPAGRPLAEKLAHDFVPMPEGLIGNEMLRRFFLRISLLWALVYITNGTATLWLLLTSSVGQFMVLSRITSMTLFVGAVTLSTLWFRRSLKDQGVVLRWSPLRA